VRLSRAIAEHVSDTATAAVPATAIEAARDAFCDTVGLGLAGTDIQGDDIVLAMARHESGVAESTVWSDGEMLSAIGATLVNAFRAGALDYDSLHPQGLVHPAVCSVPAALAIGERTHASGAELLAAIAIADDLTCRMGLAHRTNKGWYYTALYGGMAAAIAAARLLRLDASRMQSALGLAFIAACGTQIGMAERSLAKRLQTAQAAASGVRAALLAALGYPGPEDVFEGRFGFYGMYEPGDGAVLTRELGVKYRNTEAVAKRYPNCGCSHAVIEGLVGLVTEHSIAPQDVQGVEAVISPYMHRLVGAPFDADADPEVTAQFSIQYAAACAVLFRRFTLEELDPALVRHARVGDFARRVAVTVDGTNESGIVPAEVRLRLASGAELRRVVTRLRETDRDRKFCGCLTWRGRYAPDAAQEILHLARDVGALSDVSAFLSACAAQCTARSPLPAKR